MARIAFDRSNLTINTTTFRNPPRDLNTEIQDRLGRLVTAKAHCGKSVAACGPSEKYGPNSALPVGEYYWANVHVGRDFKNYSAGSDTAYFDNEAERDAYVEKRFDKITADARKKAAK